MLTFPSFYKLKSIKKCFFQKPVTEKIFKSDDKRTRQWAENFSYFLQRFLVSYEEGGGCRRERKLGKRSGLTEEVITSLLHGCSQGGYQGANIGKISLSRGREASKECTIHMLLTRCHRFGPDNSWLSKLTQLFHSMKCWLHQLSRLNSGTKTVPLFSVLQYSTHNTCCAREDLCFNVHQSAVCRRYRAKAGVGLQAVHGDDLLPLAHLDCERLGPFGDHQVGAAWHMRPPEAFAGHQLARTRDPPTPRVNVLAACWRLLARMLAAWAAAACRHVGIRHVQ